MRAEIWMGVVIFIAFQTIRKRALRILKNMTMGRLPTRLSLTSTRCEALRRISPTKKMKLSVKCWFPYPQLYTHLTTGERINFAFEGRLFQDRLLFTVMDVSETDLRQVRVTAYGRAAHELRCSLNAGLLPRSMNVKM